MNRVKFILNGKKVESIEDPTKRLLDILREEFGLTGVKEGCGEGECGACSVLMDGKVIKSCIVPLGAVYGREIVTVEGFIKTNRGKAIQKAFEKAGAVQCGMCTPGMVMAVESLLNVNPVPNEEEIREALSGNLCRCTGYNMIIQAVQYLVKEGGGLW